MMEQVDCVSVLVINGTNTGQTTLNSTRIHAFFTNLLSFKISVWATGANLPTIVLKRFFQNDGSRFPFRSEGLADPILKTGDNAYLVLSWTQPQAKWFVVIHGSLRNKHDSMSNKGKINLQFAVLDWFGSIEACQNKLFLGANGVDNVFYLGIFFVDKLYRRMWGSALRLRCSSPPSIAQTLSFFTTISCHFFKQFSLSYLARK